MGAGCPHLLIMFPVSYTHLWKHGQSGIIDIKDKIKPTYWYGKQHPFEFEFVEEHSDNPTYLFERISETEDLVKWL